MSGGARIYYLPPTTPPEALDGQAPSGRERAAVLVGIVLACLAVWALLAWTAYQALG